MYKKKLILIFLLCLVATPLFFSVYTIIEKRIIEHMMEEKMECENLQTITLDLSSITWLEKNKEALINREPFDVKTITSHGNKITLVGLFDRQEAKLKDQLQRFNNSKDGTASTNRSILLMFLITYYQEPRIAGSNNPDFIIKKQTGKIEPGKICSSYNDILIPPPRPPFSIFSI